MTIMTVVRDLKKLLGAHGQLVPFFKAVCLYFLVGAGAADPSILTAVVKCAPVLCLLFCVLFKAARSPGERGRYARRVCAGLALSAAGDAALVWPRGLAAGMALFGLAHAAYASAFGWRARRARRPALGAALALGALLAAGRPAAAAAAYGALLACGAWRGAARPGPQRAGTLLFAFSDAVLGYSMFVGPVPLQVIVMSTYYMGQLLIALSALQKPEQPQPELLQPLQPQPVQPQPVH